jgi:hypothetical protein
MRKALRGNSCCGAMVAKDYRGVALKLFLHNVYCERSMNITI